MLVGSALRPSPSLGNAMPWGHEKLGLLLVYRVTGNLKMQGIAVNWLVSGAFRKKSFQRDEGLLIPILSRAYCEEKLRDFGLLRRIPWFPFRIKIICSKLWTNLIFWLCRMDIIRFRRVKSLIWCFPPQFGVKKKELIPIQNAV